MQTFADKAIEFNRRLGYAGDLPEGFQVINPFLDNPETIEVMQIFYRKYYDDNQKRRFLIGINPGRHGAGVTGIPFTDTKRLESACGITMHSAHTHEVSSLFVYDMIEAYGGTARFYSDFYINSPFPLAIIRKSAGGSWLNANYYDDPALFEAVKGFMTDSLKKHINMGLDTSEVFILGKKNGDFIGKLNAEERLFDKLTVLEHPRYIQQYRSKEKELYIDKYLKSFYSDNYNSSHVEPHV
ncbi:MAG: SMUG2 DNA glycosylase family protein [Proteiniphilum sp.]|nr:SMUG2 DNA glycosylase family protein [Proteiniphilum sp.]